MLTKKITITFYLCTSTIPIHFYFLQNTPPIYYMLTICHVSLFDIFYIHKLFSDNTTSFRRTLQRSTVRIFYKTFLSLPKQYLMLGYVWVSDNKTKYWYIYKKIENGDLDILPHTKTGKRDRLSSYNKTE